MAYTAADNAVFFDRLRGAAVAAQNLREELKRLRDWYDLEISPSNVDDAEFVDVPVIATKDEAKTLLTDWAEQFRRMHDNQTVDAGFRGHMLLPFLTNDPQL